MPEIKHNFTKGRMNKDLDERMVPNGEYRSALNVEVSTSEGSNVGTIQTLKGNTAITDLFENGATCVGNIADENNNKLYWLVSNPDVNEDASTTYIHSDQRQNGQVTNITHDIYSDYIMEYDEVKDETNYVVVEHYKVRTMISNNSHGNVGSSQHPHIHISNLGNVGELQYTGVQPGMDVSIETIYIPIQKPMTLRGTVSKIENDGSGTWNGWRIYIDFATGTDPVAILGVIAGQTVTFELPYKKRVLGFSYFASQKPKKLITGINILDNLLFWTDGLTEPKKINIDRCKYGSQQPNPAGILTYPNGTNLFNTLLVVNGQLPSDANARLGFYDSTQTQYTPYVPLTYKEVTVVRKSPTSPLILTMANTERPDLQPIDGSVVVISDVTLPLNTSGTSDFFFSGANKLPVGDPTPTLVFPQTMDWEIGDIIEFSPHDDPAGFEQEPLASLEIIGVYNGNTTFAFSVLSLADILQKPFVNFKASLQRKDPLFEFKFPRFAYRWRYEDGEYSCFSPFSEIAFLPEEFDYFPKKGYNLGMTNNLRYLLLSGFKPKTTPLDVVEIDILYKESNSPNVYTVETIKSPSTRVESLVTSDFDGDMGWWGKIKNQSGEVEAPNTLGTSLHTVTQATTTSFIDTSSYSANLYKLSIGFGQLDIMIGDDASIAGGILLSGTTISYISYTNNSTTGDPETWVAFEYNGTAVNLSSLSSGLAAEFKRNIATKPAIYIDDPQGSLEIKTDMIHATLPTNQLLRAWDNVPKSALAQEVTGNRVVYGNYVQNYDLKNHADGSIVKPQFQTNITTRKNIRDNVQYDNRTALKHPTTGIAISWWDPINNITSRSRVPERSIKSIRDYQIGMVYCDEYGRQTPVQTHPTAKLKVPKSYADDYNGINVKIKDSETYPEWATHWKYYIKENSNEYYNLAMDRFYDAEDGNVWLSFPSSERNKVDEETFLILKKQHDTDNFVKEDARYKILAIENEAPEFVKTKYDTFGIASTAFGASGEPKYQQLHIDVPEGFFSSSGGTFYEALDREERVVRVLDATNISRWYNVVGITSYSNYKRIRVEKSFGIDMAFTTDDGTNTGTMNSGLSIELAEKKVKNLPEFEGRFFAKIYRDGVIENNILAFASDKEYITTTLAKFGYQAHDFANDCNPNRHDFVEMGGFPDDPVPPGRWFVSKICSKEQIGNNPGDTLQGLHNGDKSIHFQNHWGWDGTDWWGITTQGNNFNATSSDLDIGQRMRSSGQLFRWRGDTTVYRVTSGSEWGTRNYFYNGNWYANTVTNYYGKPSNHSVVIQMNFEPALGTTGPDAVGNPGTGYNPFNSNLEGTGSGAWSDKWRENEYTASYHRSIEFLEEAIMGFSYTSDNPAIWETEPKEDIDVDIYNEVSEMFPIKKEWNPYLNRFEDEYYYGSWRPLNYYNCFSFANGVESNRIRDDFNTVTIDKGPKVSTVLAEQYREEKRKSGLIYSGIYNSTSGINRLNQFIQAEKITKDLNPTYGSIQKLWSKDTNLVALCEDRVLGILSNKDALFNADGNSNVTATAKVLGAATPYAGDYGISTDPESFAVDQFRAYFTDKSRGSVMRMSQQGLTPISDLGMRDYFRDAFRARDITLIGGFDDNKKQYNLTIKSNSLDSAEISIESNSASTGVGTGSGVGSTGTTTTTTVINTSGIPTAGNPLGNWFRYGGVVDAWGTYMESGGTCTNWWPAQTNSTTGVVTPGYCIINEWPLVTQQAIGTTSGGMRGWTGIQGGNTHPLGIEHGREGIIANPGLTNSITLWFNEVTTGYSYTPSFDSTPNWAALSAALNTNGPGNVYLYQTFLHANSIYTGPVPLALQNWPNNWSNAHQPETVYAIQSIDHEPNTQSYKVVVDWLVGYSGYQDTQMFVWSLDSPFATTTTNPTPLTTSLSGNSPTGASCNEYGITGNSSLGLVPGSVQGGDWAGFNSSGTIEFDSQNITYVDVSVSNYTLTNVTTWLQDLLTGVNTGTPYNFSITATDPSGTGVYLAADEAVYTVSSVDAIATSSSGGDYYRVYLTWDFGTVLLQAHSARLCYYNMPIIASTTTMVDDCDPILDYDDVHVDISVSFSEDSKGWTSFKSWLQESAYSLNDKYFTFSGAELYQHHTNETRNNFYGTQYNSWVGVLFNDIPSSVKNFGALSYEGSQSRILLDTTDDEYYNNIAEDGWWTDLIVTDLETGFVPEYKEKEGKWFNYIRGNECNDLSHLDVRQFSTQGIGRALVVTSDAPPIPDPINLTVQDLGTCEVPVVVTPSDCIDGMDVAFIFDYTGSMNNVIDDIKSGTSAIVTQIQTLMTNSSGVVADYRLSLTLADEESLFLGMSPAYLGAAPYTSLSASQKFVSAASSGTACNGGVAPVNSYITNMESFSINNQASFQTQLNHLNGTMAMGSGQGGPEPTDVAVDMVGLQTFSGGWRNNVKKYIVLFTDNLPGGGDDCFDANDVAAMAALTASLVAADIKVMVIGTGAVIVTQWGNPWQDLCNATGGTWEEAKNGDYSQAVIDNLTTLCDPSNTGSTTTTTTPAASACQDNRTIMTTGSGANIVYGVAPANTTTLSDLLAWFNQDAAHRAYTFIDYTFEYENPSTPASSACMTGTGNNSWQSVSTIGITIPSNTNGHPAGTHYFTTYADYLNFTSPIIGASFTTWDETSAEFHAIYGYYTFHTAGYSPCLGCTTTCWDLDYNLVNTGEYLQDVQFRITPTLITDPFDPNLNSYTVTAEATGSGMANYGEVYPVTYPCTPLAGNYPQSCVMGGQIQWHFFTGPNATPVFPGYTGQDFTTTNPSHPTPSTGNYNITIAGPDGCTENFLVDTSSPSH